MLTVRRRRRSLTESSSTAECRPIEPMGSPCAHSDTTRSLRDAETRSFEHQCPGGDDLRDRLSTTLSWPGCHPRVFWLETGLRGPFPTGGSAANTRIASMRSGPAVGFGAWRWSSWAVSNWRLRRRRQDRIHAIRSCGGVRGMALAFVARFQLAAPPPTPGDHGLILRRPPRSRVPAARTHVAPGSSGIPPNAPGKIPPG
jgi:hypothetical protein